MRGHLNTDVRARGSNSQPLDPEFDTLDRSATDPQSTVTLEVRVVIVYKVSINTYFGKNVMVGSCVAVNCSNSRKNSPELSFHMLPKLNDNNREIRERWLANVKRHGPLPKAICFTYPSKVILLYFILVFHILCTVFHIYRHLNLYTFVLLTSFSFLFQNIKFLKLWLCRMFYVDGGHDCF